MKKNTLFEDLHNIDYKKAWDYQEELFNAVLQAKKENNVKNHLLFCEHPHVYTLGKSGSEQNLLINQIQLQAKHAQFYKINRGGDITYHGPGQIVGYPIFDLEFFNISVKEYIRKLEESIIRALQEFQIKGNRLEGATGVWMDPEEPGKARKICAIGVRASRYVTMHGFALNVNTDLSYFNYINPCGFVDKGVTSMAKETGNELDFEEVKKILLSKIAQEFELTFA